MHAYTRVVFIFVLDHVTNKGDKVACIPQINHNAVMNHPLLAHTKTPNLCTQWLTSLLTYRDARYCVLLTSFVRSLAVPAQNPLFMCSECFQTALTASRLARCTHI